MTNKYELVVILNAQMPEDQRQSVIKQCSDYIVKFGGKVINSQVWLDKYKMGFAIKKCSEGTYYLINFETTGASLTNIKEALRLNENILRYAIFSVELV